jgi:hypothetical protein
MRTKLSLLGVAAFAWVVIWSGWLFAVIVRII